MGEGIAGARGSLVVFHPLHSDCPLMRNKAQREDDRRLKQRIGGEGGKDKGQVSTRETGAPVPESPGMGQC